MRCCVALLAAATAGLLAGCLNHPPYERPQIAVPGNWSAGSAPAAVSAREATGPEGWWGDFGDPRLGELLAQALSGNADLEVAADRVLLARDALKSERAQRYPTLAIGAAPPDPIATEAVAVNSGNRVNVNPSLFALSIDASYEIDFWGRVSNSIESAKLEYQASVFDAGTVAIGLRSEVARTYFDIRELDEEISLAQRRAALASERLRLQRLRQAAGRIAEAEVGEAAVAERGAREQVEALRLSRRATVDALAVLVGVEPESLTISVAPLRTTVAAPPPQEGLPSVLLTRRPDIRAAEARLAAAHAQIEVARAQMFPQVALTARYGYVAEAVRGLVVQGGTVGGIGPAVNYSIFDGGRLAAQSDASRRRYDVLLAEYRKSIYTALADVEKSLIGYEQSVRDEARWADARSRQDVNLHHVEQSRAAGRTSRIEILAAQDQALDLELGAVRSYRQHLDCLLALYQALGGGWEPGELVLPQDAPGDTPNDQPAELPGNGEVGG